MVMGLSVFQQFNLTDPREYAAAWEIARKMIYGERAIAGNGQAPTTIEVDSERRDVELADDE